MLIFIFKNNKLTNVNVKNKNTTPSLLGIKAVSKAWIVGANRE
jgi:hypothetical protein